MLKGIVQGVVTAKKQNKHRNDWQFDDLEETPFLYSSDYLGDLYGEARNNDQKEMIYDHMLRHTVVDPEFKGYFSLSKKIEKDVWKL